MAKLNGKEIFPNLRHLKISNNNERNGINKSETPNNLVDLLYTLSLIEETDTVEKDFDEDSLTGEIIIQASYKEYIDSLKTRGNFHYYFPDLRITYTNLYILFEDSKVEQKIVDNLVNFISGYNNEYDGVISNLTLNTGFKKIFYNDRYRYLATQNSLNLSNMVDIEYFNELPQFDNLTILGADEFRMCPLLKEIDLSKIETIGSNAFYGCDKLEKFGGKDSERYVLSLPKITTDGLKNGAFQTFQATSRPSSRPSWDTDTSHTGATWNEDQLFHGPQIKYIENLGSCTVIPSDCFSRNQVLQSINENVLSQLRTINNNAFYICLNLVIEDLQIPNCTLIGNNAFEETKVRKISLIGNGCTFGNSAFYKCKQLNEISQSVFDNITKIGNNCFNECTSLLIDNLRIPQLTEIGTDAFKGTQLRAVSDTGLLTTISGFSGCLALRNVTLNPRVNTIGQDAFRGCTALLTDDIKTILTTRSIYSGYCFYGCTQISDIIYMPTITTIGYNVFGNTHVKGFYFPNLKNSNGLNETNVPIQGRHNNALITNSLTNNNQYVYAPNIFYLKNITKINGFTFGGHTFGSRVSTISWGRIIGNGTNRNNNDPDYPGVDTGFSMSNTMFMSDSNSFGSKEINGVYDKNNEATTKSGTPEYRQQPLLDENGRFILDTTTNRIKLKDEINVDPWFFGTQTDGWNDQSTAYANIKYLVINNVNPPKYWQSLGESYGTTFYGSLSLYVKNDNGSQQTFKYLCVPKAAIEKYKQWDALNPPLNNAPESQKEYLIERTHFNVDSNIIAIESMNHFKTYEDYLRCPNSDKDDYLIEEYMGLTQEELNNINWDNPAWTA